MKNFPITSILVLLFILASSFAQINSTLAEDLQDTLDYVYSVKNISGTSTAIVIPNNEIWTDVSGISHDAMDSYPRRWSIHRLR